MSEYYAGYTPANARHFRDMLNQFRKAKGSEDLKNIAFLWVMSHEVDRQDIIVALGRVERERGFQ